MISIVVPVFNEETNIARLLQVTTDVMKRFGRSYEIIVVDDGSRDQSFEVARRSAVELGHIKIIKFSRNYGQTAGLMAGIDHASGDIIVPIDADLQNDPQDIPSLVERLEEGNYGFVSGWRKSRKDAKFRRVFLSQVANRIISSLTGVILHDYGCSLKAYQAKFVKNLPLYGEMHRFVPVLASWRGAKYTEMVVTHYPRASGRSNYGMERIFKVVWDVSMLLFFKKYITKPGYVLGGAGMWLFAVATTTFAYACFLKITENVAFISTPLLLIGASCALSGVMAMLMGILAEILVRTYYESQGKSVYSVLEIWPAEAKDATASRRVA